MSEQQKALRLAEIFSSGQYNNGTAIQAAEELRSQHAEWVSMMADRRRTERKLADTKADNERLREALSLIASCQSHHSGDVVDIAKAALKGAK